MLWKQAREMLANASHILLLCHHNADRDAFGAVTAFGLFLQNIGKSFSFAYYGNPPLYTLTLDPSFTLRTWIKTEIDLTAFDLIVVLDTGATHLLGQTESLVTQNTLPILNIDHHRSNDRYGRINIVDVESAACCELLYTLFCETQEMITPNMAHALLVGLLGDTHALRTSHVTPHTLRTTAELMERGADRAAILEQMPSIESVATARVWGKLLQNIQTVREHQNIAYTIVDASMIDPDTSISLIGISSFIRDMGGVDIAILFLQESPDEIRVEFRSKGQYDVSKIAESLGGGGHRGAAGCRYRGISINQAVERTIQAVEQAVRG